MGDIFVFTAINQAAKFHLEDSIRNPIPINNIRPYFSVEEQKRLEGISQQNGGLFAWGAKRGKANYRNGRYRNIDTWSQMHPGDYVLGVYDKHYRVFSWVLTKFHNADAAKAIWGVDGEDGETWEYVYVISEPQLIKIPVEEKARYLPSGYIGFTRISQERTAKINEQFDSLERYLNSEFEVTPPAGYGGDHFMNEVRHATEAMGVFIPASMDDARHRIYEALVRRKGPSRLWQDLMTAYGCCAITGESCQEVLEATFILPFKEDHTNHVSNSLLMRSDLHILYDRGLITIDTETMSIIVSDNLKESHYAVLHGQKITLPHSSEAQPNRESLDIHRRWCGL